MSAPCTALGVGKSVLSVRDLAVTFTGAGRPVPAVRGISFDVYPGEVLGIVGESGSGKSVACLAVAAVPPQLGEQGFRLGHQVEPARSICNVARLLERCLPPVGRCVAK